MPESPDPRVPQFATAEYTTQSAAAPCKVCGKPLGNPHYRINGFPACADCAQQIKSRLPIDSHAAFVRGISFGIGGALLGLILYVVFAVATGLVIGFVSLAVGYLVGKAIVKGSGGLRGRRYQLAAVLLTYAAVSLSAVPIAILQHMKQSHVQEQSQGSAESADARPVASYASVAGQLAMLGLASPFLDLSDPVHGAIGLIILFVGLRIAWRLTASSPLNIVGPLTEAGPVAPG
jgi:hypothetical protein